MKPSGEGGLPGLAGLAGGLFDRRILLVHGALGDAKAGELSIALMTLDATGDDPITLQLDSADGTVDGALAVIDTIDLACLDERPLPSVRATRAVRRRRSGG